MWLGFDPFRPVQNHIGSGAGNPAYCYVRFGPRRWPSRFAHSHLQLLFFSSTYCGDWSLCVVMALASLRFQRCAQDNEETRQGMTVFAGDAASFHEWQFRLQIKKSLCKAEELPALTAKVVDALRGEALSCAMEIGLAKLMEADGLDLLVQKVQERLFPQRTAEARELLKQGMRVGGPMSRVSGEPMTSTSRVVVVGGPSCTRWTTRQSSVTRSKAV